MPSKLKSSDPESPPSTSGDSAAPTLGLREKHKIDKLRRIRSSARKVFLEKGFDAATTREVAEIAEVSHATVFLYAKDKRDLLFLVFNDDLDAVTDKALASTDRTKPLLDQLVQLFVHFYRYFGHDPQIGLLGIHEHGAAASSDTPQMLRVRARSERLSREVCAMIDAGKASGRLATKTNTALAMRVIIAVYFAELDHWLRAATQDVDAGMRALRSAFRLVIEGLRAH